MPFTFLSHQALILPIKIRWKKQFNLPALILGTILPDIESIMSDFIPNTHLLHSFIGILIIIVPLSTILYIVGYLGLKILRERNDDIKVKLDEFMRYFGTNQWNIKKDYGSKTNFLFGIIISSFIGAFTHLLLDWPSHETLFFFFPIIIENPKFFLISLVDLGTLQVLFLKSVNLNLTIAKVIWILETIIGALISINYLKKIFLCKELGVFE